MKKILSVLLTLLLCAGALRPFAAAARTEAAVPFAEARLLFTKKLGTGYRNAPTPLAVTGSELIVAAGKYIYKLDAATGETLARTLLESVSTYTAVPPAVAEGKIFLPLDDGVVQAFDLETLSTLWVYTDPLGGQGLCPVTYENGYVYTGFWNGETDEANYVCLPASGSGEQTAIWRFAAAGGFYRAEALIAGDYILFGSDNGLRTNQPEAPGTVYCLNKTTGEKRGDLALPGDIRAGIGRDPETGDCFAATKAGALCRFTVNAATGALTKQTQVSLPGGMTVAPEIDNGRLYAACANSGKGLILVLDAATLQTVYTADLPGVPQGNLLLSTAYKAGTGKVLLCATCNAAPGGIWILEDGAGQTEGEAAALFEPEASMAQYCFCPLAVGEDGALYYKNDSGNIFAVAGNERRPAGFRELLERWQKLFRLLAQILKGAWRAA